MHTTCVIRTVIAIKGSLSKLSMILVGPRFSYFSYSSRRNDRTLYGIHTVAICISLMQPQFELPLWD